MQEIREIPKTHSFEIKPPSATRRLAQKVFVRHHTSSKDGQIDTPIDAVPPRSLVNIPKNTEEPKNPRIARINAEKGIRKFSFDTLQKLQVELFRDAFWRNIPCQEETKDPDVWVNTVVREALGGYEEFRRSKTKKPYYIGDLSRDDRIIATQKVLLIAEGQKHLLDNAEFVEIPIEGGMSIGIQYGSSNWDGAVGAVRFYIKDEVSKKFIPAYSIRGVPWKKDDVFSFNIRTVQAWAGDEQPGISYLKEGADAKTISLLRERQRLTDKLIRFMNRGVPIKDQNPVELTEEDIFLLFTISYFQKYGIREFQGIEHGKHWAVKAGKPLNFNYDYLFGKWFDRERSESEFGGWSLKSGKGPYIPKFDNLSANARAIIPKIFSS